MKLQSAACAALASLCLQTAALAADPDDKVHTLDIVRGERELELTAGSWREAGERLSATTLSFGYGLGDRWVTEVGVKTNKEAGRGWRYDAFEWENKFLFTERGRHFADLGLFFEVERPRERAEGWELKAGPMVQADVDKWQLNANILLERHFRSEEEARTELGYQLQAKYRWQPALEFGAQVLGEVGEWNHWAPSREQTHRAGPALFGRTRLGAGQMLKYEAAVLLPLSSAAPRGNVRLLVEYEF